jgi:hypothetical protein
MKTKFGAIIVDGRGKIGGHVASKNRAGSYMRTKVTPVNAQTSYQSTVRNRLTSLSQGWRSLTDAQRAAWNSSVSDYAKTDIFGDLRNPSGFNLYQKLNNNLLNVGQSAILLPPIPQGVDAFTAFTASAAAGTPALSLTFAPAVAVDMSVKLFATSPQSAGKSFVKSEYREIGVLTSTSASPFNALSLYTAKYGSIGSAGQKIFLKMVQVNETTGQEGTPIVTSAVIAA